ncbi:amino acid adenylation domain-containing protein [Actinomadura sp. NPDC047616]|uniref:amino acid adenylation domain-containing protein n=1 Tax=Actinomadura sp. NPDC047616 TaxID=3155914 RepID=UPI0033DC678D
MSEVSSSSLAVGVDEVAGVVAEVLGVEAVDPDAPLTVLGLDSFTAVRLRRRLRELGLDLPMTAFLGNATVRGVATGGAEPGERDEGFPLTPLQAAYWIGRDPAFPLGGVATFYYREYDRVPGPEGAERDLARLTAAWNRLVAHHPMLRMIVDGEGRQHVLPTVDEYEIEVVDLRADGEQEADARLAAMRHECSHQVRDAGRWPLFDVRAAFLPDGRTRILLGVDVLALDLAGWMQILAEWGDLVADPAADLPAAPITFAELVERRAADPAEAERRERDRAYWRRRADALAPGPSLPWATDLAELRRHRFSRWAGELSSEEWGALRGRAAGRGLSPTGVLLAAFGLVLARWGASAPFCLNTTLFDRPDDPELAHLVGDFTSTVLVEVPDAGTRGFGEFAARVNRRFWTDMEHRAVSGVEVLRDAGVTGLTPRYPVVFTSGVGLSDPERDPAAWLGEEVFGISQTPQVALDHIVHEEGGRLRIAWDAVDGAFADGFVAGMRDAHLRLLRRLAAEEDVWDDPGFGWDPTFLPEEPLDRSPFGDAGPLLNDPLRAAAQAMPDNAALLDPAGGLTHGELAEGAERIGGVLAASGVGPGDLVAVAFDKGIDQVTALLGVCASGAGYVPVEPSWPAGRIASVCEQAGVRTALVPEGSAVEWPPQVRVHGVTGEGERARPRAARADDLAYVIFTSGSTGRPKGVAIEHRAARTTIDDLIDRFPVGPDDRVLGLSAFSFDLSVHDIFGVMGTGAALVLPDADRQRDPGHWLDLMERHRVTVWNTAPALMEMLVEYAEIEPERARAVLAPLRLVFLSADWIPVTLPDRIRALAPRARVVSLGGATEASIWSICHPIGDVDPSWPSIPYGRPLRGQSFHILDRRGRPCPVGEAGELHIGGDGLARGYIGDEAQTRERFVVDPVLGRRLYRTGDLGRWRTDGTIEFLGRLDRQVKIRGHRIELGEVESALNRAPGVRHSVALSVRGPDDRPRLVAYLVAAGPGEPPSDDALIAHLRDRVPDFMVPSRMLWLEEFPVTANGKIDYAALPNPYRRAAAPPEQRPARDPAAPAAPAASEEEGLAALLRQAGEQGLDVAVRISGGTLSPARALTAAGEWAGRLSAAAAGQGVTLHERLPADGLIELGVVTAPIPAPPPEPPVPPARPPAETVRAPEPEPAATGEPAADPEVERVVAETLGELLGGVPVDVTTPFMRLGATSLTLVRAHARLTERLDPGLSVVDLFTRPTVRDLAAWITARRTDQAVALPERHAVRETAADPAARRAHNRRLARRQAAEAAR